MLDLEDSLYYVNKMAKIYKRIELGFKYLDQHEYEFQALAFDKCFGDYYEGDDCPAALYGAVDRCAEKFRGMTEAYVHYDDSTYKLMANPNYDEFDKGYSIMLGDFRAEVFPDYSGDMIYLDVDEEDADFVRTVRLPSEIATAWIINAQCHASDRATVFYAIKDRILSAYEPTEIHEIGNEEFLYYVIGDRSFHSPLTEKEYDKYKKLPRKVLDNFEAYSLDTLDSSERDLLESLALHEILNHYVSIGSDYCITLFNKYRPAILKVIFDNMEDWISKELECIEYARAYSDCEYDEDCYLG